MPSKRRNNGRGKKNKGHSDTRHCYNCGRVVPKDKSIKRYNIRKMVDASSKRDIEEATAYPGKTQAYSDRVFALPKLYMKLYYCVSCAIHLRIVRVRSSENRKLRTTSKLRTVRAFEGLGEKQERAGEGNGELILKY